MSDTKREMKIEELSRPGAEELTPPQAENAAGGVLIGLIRPGILVSDDLNPQPLPPRFVRF